MRIVRLHYIDEGRLCTIVITCFVRQGALPSHGAEVKREYIEANRVQDEWVSTTTRAKPAKRCFRLQ